MIDVHFITKPDDSAEWLDLCLNSLRGEPIVLHQINAETGVPEGLIRSRLNGFSCGTQDLVSFVDPDDYIIPGLFSKLEGALEQAPNAVAAFAHEFITGINGKIGFNVNQQPHHAIVYRRSWFNIGKDAMLAWTFPALYSEAVAPLIKLGVERAIEVKEPLYVWRRHCYSTLFVEQIKSLKRKQIWPTN